MVAIKTMGRGYTSSDGVHESPCFSLHVGDTSCFCAALCYEKNVTTTNQRVFNLNYCVAMPVTLVSTVYDSIGGFAEDPTSKSSSLVRELCFFASEAFCCY